MSEKVWFFLGFLILLALASFARVSGVLAGPNPQATIEKSIFIQNPRDGQALQGVEMIEGKIRGEGFLKGTIHFSYAEAPDQDRTWFYIAEIETGNGDSSQASFVVEWDTTQITDGNYDLRVVAEYTGGAALFELVRNIRIRNLSSVETATPGPQAVETNQGALLPATEPPQPNLTSTPFPTNPVEVGTGELQRVLLISGVVVAGLFFVGMIYWYFSNRFR